MLKISLFHAVVCKPLILTLLLHWNPWYWLAWAEICFTCTILL